MTLSLRARDAKAILSDRHQVFLDARLARVVAAADFGGLSLTIFTPDGLCYRPDGDGCAENDGHVTIDAVPHDVLAIVGIEEDDGPARALIDVFSANDAEPMPALLTIPEGGSEDDRRRAVLAVLVPHLATRLARISSFYADREAELAEARKEAETRALALRLGREMVSALGYGARSLAYEVSPGDRTIGPHGDFGLASFVVRLPVDLSGLCAISLHVADRRTTNAETGHLVVTIGSPDLRHPLLRTEIAYADLPSGWNDIVFDAPVGVRHGDGMLTVAFLGEEAPHLSMGAERTDRFGLVGSVEGRSPALRVWKGFAPDLFSTHSAVPRRIETLEPDLTSATFLFGPAEEAAERQRHAGQAPIVLLSSRSVRVLARSDAPTGAVFSELLPKGTSSVRLVLDGPPLSGGMRPDGAETVQKTASAGPLSDFLSRFWLSGRRGGKAAPVPGMSGRTCALVALPPGLAALGTLREKAAAVLAGEWKDEAFALILEDLPDNGSRTVRLDLDPPLSEPGSFAVLLDPRTSEGSYGIRDLSIDLEGVSPTERLPVFGRRVPLPELKSRTAYLFGAGEAARLSQAAGLPVMQVSDVENHMETHALQDRITGARIAGLLTTGVTMVRAVVETAHSEGPDVEYGLLVLQPGEGRDDPDGFARTLEAYLKNGLAVRPSFVLAGAVRAVGPGVAGLVTLRLDEPLRRSADLVLTVRSLSGHTNYAWCRWQAIDVVAAPESGAPRHEASSQP